MKLEEFGEFKAPKRWPWLLLAVLVLAAIASVRIFRRGDKAAPAPGPVAVETVTVPGATPAAQPGGSAVQIAHAAPVAGVFPTNSAEMLKAGSDLEGADRLLEARDYYRMLLAGPLRAADRADVETRLGRVGVKLVTSPRPTPEKIDYVVQRGDSLDRIAKRNGTTVDLLQLSNTIMKPNLIRAGDALRVFTGKFRIEVSKARNDMIVYMNDQFFNRYRIGSGKFGKTPEGTFNITERIKEPAWWRPDGKEVPYGAKENILGTRWMTLRAAGTTPDVRGYGIHGTWEPESIGKSESAGCIRMRNEDVEELFVLVPVGTPVTIVQ